MEPTYEQLEERIATLQKSIDEPRAVEVAPVVHNIRLAIRHYSLTQAQLFGRSPRANKALAAARYADGRGRTWSGRGRRPQWVCETRLAGAALADLTGTHPQLQAELLALKTV